MALSFVINPFTSQPDYVGDPGGGGGGGGNIASINGDASAAQLIATGTAGTDVAIVDVGNIHTINIPTADATHTGKLAMADWSLFSGGTTNVGNLVTLSGVAANEPDLGTFTGTTIPDDSTIKAALQALEIEVETKEDSGTAAAALVAHNAAFTHSDIALNTAARHTAVTIGTANGLSIIGQAISLAEATNSTIGTLSAVDYYTLTNKASTDINSQVVYPYPLQFTGTNRTAGDEATLISNIAASTTGDIVTLTSDITLTSTLVINKSIKLDGAFILQSAGAAGDPVTLISVTANNVYITNNVTIKHRKTSNTSVEVAISVVATGFISNATIEFMEAGYTLRGSFSIGGKTTYTGALANTHRHFIIYQVSAASQVNGVVYDFPSEATPRSSFIYHTVSVGTDNFDNVLRIANNTQLDKTKIHRQFYLCDGQQKSIGGTPALIFDNNYFNDLNGGIGLFSGAGVQPLDFYSYIVLINNIQGSAAVGNNSYKGMFYLDGDAPIHAMGSTSIYYSGNSHPTTLRSAGDYTSAIDYSGITYENTSYSNLVPLSISTNIQTNNSVYNYTREFVTQTQLNNNPLTYRVEKFTLSAGDIANKYIDLAISPQVVSKTRLTVIGGPEQDYSVDFDIITNGSGFIKRLSWSGLWLDGVLSSGDKLIVIYS